MGTTALRSHRFAVVRAVGAALALTLALSACTGPPAAGERPPSATAPVPAPATSPAPTVAPTPSGAPSAPTPPAAAQRVVFGDPWSSNHARAHAVALSALRLIEGARKGQTVSLSMFNMTYPTAADTLIRAHRRGVNVRVVLNHEGRHSKQVRLLRQALGGNTRARSWAVIRGGGVRMHAKFLLVSPAGGKGPVVWVSSGNLTLSSGRDQANEALITTGDDQLYRFLAAQFVLLRQGVTDPTRLARTATTATATVQTFPLPEGGAAHDPVAALLADVSCERGGSRTIVRVAHLFLTEERLHLAQRLRLLVAAGCDVRVAGYLRMWRAPARRILLAPGAGKVDLRAVQGTALHTKIITIDGFDAAGEPLKVALVGTHNLTGRALSAIPEGVNDEIALRIGLPGTVDTYSAWVDMVIKRHSAPARG